MDLGTVIGLVAAFGLVLVSMILGGGVLPFVDVPSAVMVLGGTAGVLFVGFPPGAVMEALKAAKTAFTPPSFNASDTVQMLAELSNRARREGLLSLEAAADETEDDFLKRGLRMMADGHEAPAIESVLFEEIAKIDERHKRSIAVWDGVGAYGPAMGMIGTLVGLVLMLGSLSDPTTIGPKMAIALITTFYGAVLANMVGIPIASKLKLRSAEEIAAKELTAQGLLSILAGENPRFMVERLNATLAPKDRHEEAA